MDVGKLVRMSVLLDFYGGMLTSTQYEIARSYVDYNSSLAEIAEDTHTSRQAVNDILHRTFKKLEDFESKLGFLKKYERVLNSVEQTASECELNAEEYRAVVEHFTKLIESLKE